MKNSPLLLCLCALLFAACHKNEKKPSPYQNGGTVIYGDPPPVKLTNCYGEILFSQNVYLDYTMPQPYFVGAFFFTAPINNQTVTLADVGDVTMSGVLLNKNFSTTGQVVYIDTTQSFFSTHFALKTSGGQQPSIGFSYNGNAPQLGDTALLPREINRPEGLELKLGKITDADSVMIGIDDLSSNTFYKRQPVRNASVAFNISAADLSVLSATQNGALNVTVTKNELVTVAGRDYLIAIERRYYRMYVKIN